MSAMSHRLLVVGGNGFIGSAVCKVALARGMQVTSVSSSGKPYTTPKGHSPAWTSKVTWLPADALDPSSYAHLLPGSTAVVHTIGTLLEDTKYKNAMKDGDFRSLAASVFESLVGGKISGSNPLERDHKDAKGTYEVLNRDAALRVCETYLSTPLDRSLNSSSPRTFVYVSAEDIFRPFIPSRYIETKREAERGIEKMLGSQPNYRGIYIRPSLVYHSHIRPLTTPLATILDLSSTLHRNAPTNIPTPSSIIRSLGSAFSTSSPDDISSSSSLHSVANALTIPPIHVEHVAEAICAAIQNDDVRGVVGVKTMRELIGWSEKGSAVQDSQHPV